MISARLAFRAARPSMAFAGPRALPYTGRQLTSASNRRAEKLQTVVDELQKSMSEAEQEIKEGSNELPKLSNETQRDIQEWIAEPQTKMEKRKAYHEAEKERKQERKPVIEAMHAKHQRKQIAKAAKKEAMKKKREEEGYKDIEPKERKRKGQDLQPQTEEELRKRYGLQPRTEEDGQNFRPRTGEDGPSFFRPQIGEGLPQMEEELRKRYRNEINEKTFLTKQEQMLRSAELKRIKIAAKRERARVKEQRRLDAKQKKQEAKKRVRDAKLEAKIQRKLALAETHGEIQVEKPLNPHLTNTTSTITNNIPSAGTHNVPPELISSVDPEFAPKDSSPENTERMTGGTQDGEGKEGTTTAETEVGETAAKQTEVKQAEVGEIGVGEMEGASFKVEPLRRTGEDANTMRARLLYQSRKRGTLESDLLMSTFAEAHLRDMTMEQMTQFDLFLDENDWDIYYWATQQPSPTSQETAEGAGKGPEGATASVQGIDKTTDAWRQGKARSGEWAQTIGTFKPAYRPVPIRWKNSEILSMLRRHVISRSAGGVIEEGAVNDESKQSGGGMAFMPPVFPTDR